MPDTNTSILFTGDIGFTRYLKDKWQDPDLISPEILDFFHSARHVVANVEGALIDPENANFSSSKGIFFHYMHKGAKRVLDEIGADVWCLANNHIMDMGDRGLYSTLDAARESGSGVVGAGKDIESASRPLILAEAGGIGMIAVGFSSECPAATEKSAGVLTYDQTDRIQKRIRKIKKEQRWCIVIAHDGEEFTSLPSPYVRDRYLSYLNMGADLVVAHHPHVVMNYERVGEKAIFYSLGNFIFDTDYQRAQMHTENGLLLKIDFTPDSFTFTPFGVKLLRDEGRLVKDRVSPIFTEVPEEEYRLLFPLAARAFIQSEKKRYLYMEPEKFENATEEDWRRHLLSPLREEYVPGEHMDFSAVLPYAEKAKEGAWQMSRLEGVTRCIK